MKIKKQKWAGEFQLEDENGESQNINIKYIDLNDLETIQEIEKDGADKMQNLRKIFCVYCPEMKEDDFSGIPMKQLNELLVYLTEVGTGQKLSSDAKKKLSGNA